MKSHWFEIEHVSLQNNLHSSNSDIVPLLIIDSKGEEGMAHEKEDKDSTLNGDGEQMQK